MVEKNDLQLHKTIILRQKKMTNPHLVLSLLLLTTTLMIPQYALRSPRTTAIFVDGFIVIQPSTRKRIASIPLSPSSSSRLTTKTSVHSSTSTATEQQLQHTSSSSSPYYSITTSTGPAGNPIHTLTFHKIPGESDDVPPTVLQSGKIGRLANGAINLLRGDTVLYSTACTETDDSKEATDFTPLSVEHQERFSSAGLTSGSFHKRDGRPAEHEILTARLIDRAVRPLLSGFTSETQVISWVLSYDGLRSCDPLAVTAGAAALAIASEIPLKKPVAAVEVGIIVEEEVEEAKTEVNDGEESEEASNEAEVNQELIPEDNNGMKKEKKYRLIVNPSNKEKEHPGFQLHLTIAGTADAILMLEGEADFLPEPKFIEAIEFGHAAIRVICNGVQDFADHINENKVKQEQQYLNAEEEKQQGTPFTLIQKRVNEALTQRVDEYYALNGSKQVKGKVMGGLYDAVQNELKAEFSGIDEDSTKVYLNMALKELLRRRMYHHVATTGTRDDGRSVDQVRPISIETSILPRVHGSALFTRGETQAIATATLGDSGMKQKIDTIDGLYTKRFYLQYTFPPSCVGETGRVGTPGRREIGHGNLAERALLPSLPSELDFPYAIRVESLITESHGSSSMASVCGGCLALMDAGVPIQRTVAGIAMGMLLEDESGNTSDQNAIVLSDITGTEDALGTMDFKVAGDRRGITTFQLDIKCEGLTLETMSKALEQARIGRLHILDEMEKVLALPRSALPETVPKMLAFQISPDTIGRVIGPGGKQIRAIIEDFELVNMDVSDEGYIQLTSFQPEMLEKAKEFVATLVGPGVGGRGAGGGEKKERPKYNGPEPVEGEIYTGKITGIHPFGVFVEILPSVEPDGPGLEGLVHVSELARERVRNCEAFVNSMDVTELTVKYLGKEKGKHKLSRKAVLEEQFGNNRTKRNSSSSGYSRGGDVGETTTESSPLSKASTMEQDELAIIAQAIDGTL